MPSEEPLTERLADLEARYTHLQHDFETLNQVVVEQQAKIDRLELVVQRLESRLRRLERLAEGGTPLDESAPAE